MAIALQCDNCDGPRSRYSETGLCSKCEYERTTKHVEQCRSDIENNVHITHRMGVKFPNLCVQCYSVLPEPSKVGTWQKFCSRACKYKFHKANGKPSNAR